MTRETRYDASLDDLDRFPPTVVGHAEYSDGVDLHLLDSGTEEDPRIIQIYDGDRETEAFL